MIKLVLMELKKIFKHKSIYVMLVIIFLFGFLNDVLYMRDYDLDGNYKYENVVSLDKEIERLNKKLAGYDVFCDDDKRAYVTVKSNLDVLKVKKMYDKNSWQYIKADAYLYEVIYNINYYKYVDVSLELEDKFKKQYDDLFLKFKNNNWQYFVNLEKNELVKKIFNLNYQLESVEDKEEKDNISNEIKSLERDLVIVNYRLNEKISYSNNYLNRALVEYRDGLEYFGSDISSDSYQETLDYNNNLSKMKINKFIIDNKINVNKENTLNYQLRNVVGDYELFIVIIVLMVFSIVIGEEFSKGTIKLLLIKPYSRNKILFGKYIASLVVIGLVIVFVVLQQLIVGSFIFGIDSLKEGCVVYNFNSNSVVCLNIFVYMFIKILVRIPMIVFLMTFCFVLGILFSNTMVAFSITMLFYTFSSVINSMIVDYKLKFMQYFITINWVFDDYLFGGISNFQYINLKKSILIYLIYVIILLIIMFFCFGKKNIKNV